MMRSQAEGAARHRYLQRARPQRGSGHICQLIAVLGCFQFLVVTTLVSVSMLSLRPSSPLYAASVSSDIRELESTSASRQLELWVQELLKARTVSLEINSTQPTHLDFSLRGTLVPRPSHLPLFDGEFAFSDARTPQRYVVMVQNRGYQWVTSGHYGERLVRSGCLHAAQLPPLQTLRRAFHSARWTPSDSVEFAFTNDLFRVAKSRTGFHVTSSNGLQLRLKPNYAPLQPLPDFVSKVQELNLCPRLFENETLTAEKVPEDLEVAAQTVDAREEECPCTSQEKKKCLFLHGIGVHEDLGLTETFPDYWGAIEKLLPCCSVVKFTHLNSVDSPWYDELFAERVCDAMLAVAHNTSFVLDTTTESGQRNATSHAKIPVVENTVVVAHSTGNLYLASALLYKKCQLDPESSKWIAIQGPMRGTNTANRVLEECAKPAGGWDALVQTVVREFELCPVKNSTESLALAGSPATSGCLDKLFDKAQAVYEATAYANLCGVSPFGLTSTSSPKFVALAKFSNHSSTDNDGVVEFGSCAKRDAQYHPTYRNRNRFYRASINHDDGRLIHGDGLWGDDRKPTKWLQCQF